MTTKGFLAAFLITIPSFFIGAFAAKAHKPDPIIKAMAKEAKRYLNSPKATKTNVKPYFISYKSVFSRVQYFEIENGALISKRKYNSHNIFPIIRVGSYEIDNTDLNKDFFQGVDIEVSDHPGAALNFDPKSLSYKLWLLSDNKLKSSLYEYFQKRSRQVVGFKSDEKPFASFSKEKPFVDLRKENVQGFKSKKFIKFLSLLSGELALDQYLISNRISFRSDQTTTRIYNTEGLKLRFFQRLYSLTLHLKGRDKKGKRLDESQTFYFRDILKKPSQKKIKASFKKLIKNFYQLANSEELETYTGPAIFLADAAGVLFHEALGHRLEGERLLKKYGGHTFKGKLGQKVAPKIISLFDDPTKRDFEGHALNGYYPFDSEGVSPKNVTLIKKGILMDFLRSRTPVSHKKLGSNGHGRSSGYPPAMGRMGNLELEVHKKVSYQKLEKMLITEAKKQGKKYALILSKVKGGETNTSRYGFQAFKGSPSHVFKINVKTGKKSLHRGLSFVGTPLLTISKIMAASNKKRIFNGFCGAESGTIPVSTIAPDILVSQIEMQRGSEKSERLPILKAPKH